MEPQAASRVPSASLTQDQWPAERGNWRLRSQAAPGSVQKGHNRHTFSLRLRKSRCIAKTTSCSSPGSRRGGNKCNTMNVNGSTVILGVAAPCKPMGFSPAQNTWTCHSVYNIQSMLTEQIHRRWVGTHIVQQGELHTAIGQVNR